ncbi:MAG: Glycosyl transferases group 1 [Candidatus Argoarchaeum ethanivorans]|uniref:Glycosyl transferases group 1 n=1 Tax=Candidatus Argoarchaeum ethanivorans TaxID=2608793 RepID=A0A811T9L3_9EURY|nr:MAG: Glycosyl transferases group 1 [Candidatus Argoarchaeum ethanivorans]
MIMKLCYISKYPPIEGGESGKAYWLAKALGEKGHEIHVVTNAWEVESEYREHFEVEDIYQYQPKNVTVYNTDPFVDPQYIPYSKPYTEKIASLSIEVIKENNLELIDSWYILPYVISGYVAKTIVKKPQILRHAGSDMSRLLNSPYLHTLFIEIFKRVDKIVTYPGMKQLFLNYGVLEEKVFLNTKVSVDSNVFHPNVKPFDSSTFEKGNLTGCSIITYIGKVGVTKGVFELTEALSKIHRDFILLFVCGGKMVNKLKEDVKAKKLDHKTVFLDFVPPWQIPHIMKASTCIVLPERDFPVTAHTPILPREAMCAGRCTILSEELYGKRRYSELENGVHTIVVNPKDIDELKRKLEKVIIDPDYANEIGKNARKLAEKYEDFDTYISSMEDLYRNVING